MNIMIYIGKTRFDKIRRITLLKEISDLLFVEEGDNILFYADDGKIIIMKETELYNGYPFEKELIEERVRKYEEYHKMMKGELQKPEGPEFDYEDNEQRTLTMEEQAERNTAYQDFLKDVYERQRKTGTRSV